MDIEHLNKSQIVLLTLLVSFVTSIATGIVTVALMQQAPPVIPQTINRVVERTVQTVVPKETQTATVITTEKTVMVKEADAITKAVAQARTSAVMLYVEKDDKTAGDFIARGFIIASGYAVVPLSDAAAGKTFIIGGDKPIEARVVKIDSTFGLGLLSFTQNSEQSAAILNTDSLALGQTIIALTGTSGIRVADGIVTSVHDATKDAPATFETNVDSLTLGSPIINTDGAVIGIFAGADAVPGGAALTAFMRSVIPDSGKAASTTLTSK